MNGLTYSRIGDYDIPNLTLSVQIDKPLGKYGRMRRRHLREHHPILYNQMVLNETLFLHLAETDRAANERKTMLMPRFMASAGITEALKEHDPMKWVGLMNSLDSQVEEIIYNELIFA